MSVLSTNAMGRIPKIIGPVTGIFEQQIGIPATEQSIRAHRAVKVNWFLLVIWKIVMRLTSRLDTVVIEALVICVTYMRKAEFEL